MAVQDLCEMASPKTTSLEAWHVPKQVDRRAKDGDRQSRVILFGGRALRVLVVGHAQDQNDELTQLVRCNGHEVREAHTGHGALRVAAKQHPDVVLLQLEMPLMCGIQVARHLRRDFPSRNCLIIALAPRIDHALRRKCRNAGIDLLFVAPLVADVVETLLMLEWSLVNRPMNAEEAK